MEYGPENNIFALKMMMKSGLEKKVLKFLQGFNPFLENLFYFIEGDFYIKLQIQ